jgi:hypothetical protein
MASQPCLVGSRPWSNFEVALTTLQSMWWYLVLLLWLVSYGNNLKLLKFLVFEVFSCYPRLHFTSSMITICYNIKLCLMCEQPSSQFLGLILMSHWLGEVWIWIWDISVVLPLFFVSLENHVLLVSWCVGGRCGMVCSNEDCGGSRRPSVED